MTSNHKWRRRSRLKGLCIKTFEWDIAPNPAGGEPSKTYAAPDQISIWSHSKHREAAWRFVQYVVFNLDAQKLLGTTGAPVLLKYLLDKERISAEASQKPRHYGIFVEGAARHGERWLLSNDIAKLEQDADDKIFNDPSVNINKVLEQLNSQAQALLDKGSS